MLLVVCTDAVCEEIGLQSMQLPDKADAAPARVTKKCEGCEKIHLNWPGEKDRPAITPSYVGCTAKDHVKWEGKVAPVTILLRVSTRLDPSLCFIGRTGTRWEASHLAGFT